MEPRKRLTFPFLLPLAALALTLACSSSESPTSTGGSALLSGTLISGTGPAGLAPQGAGGPLVNVTVTVVSTGQWAQTDGAGNFNLGSVPAGKVQLTLVGPTVNATVSLELESGATVTVVIAAAGSSATVVSQDSTGGGHFGAEIEGIVQSVNAAGGSLTVADERLGTVTVKTDASTVIRKGGTTMTLADIKVGWRVHVKASKQSDGSYLATEIIVQNTTGS